MGTGEATQNRAISWEFTRSSETAPLVIALRDGRLKYLEDPKQPDVDAIKEFCDDPDNVGVVLMPPCSPTTINALAKTFPAMTRAIVIDHYPVRLETWEKLAQPNVNIKVDTLLLNKNIAPDKHRLIQLLDQSPLQYYLGKFKLYFPRRHRRLESDFAEYLEILRDSMIQNMALKLRFQEQESWHQALNALVNIKNKSVKKYKFKTRQPNVPFVVVGAGPSLDDNIEVLKAHKDKVIILACERALATMKHHDIKPDYILCVENIHGMMRHFDEHLEFIEGIPLIAPYSVTHIVPQHYNGPVIFTNNGTDDAWINPLNKFKTDAGLCVGHYGFHIADALNPTKIILIGSDLAFKDGRSHTSHTHSDGLSKNTIETAGYYGGVVETSSTFKSYIDLFVGLINDCKVPVINATEGGAYIPGAEHITLDEALRNLPLIDNHSLYDLIPQKQVQSFYKGLVKSIKKARNELIESQAAFDRLEPNNPMHFFGFIKRGIQVLFNQYNNTRISLNYHEIRTNYNPGRFESFKQATRELWQEMFDACEFMLAIDRTASYDGGEKDNCLVFVSREEDLAWFKGRYPKLNVFEMAPLQPLPEIWKVITENNIGQMVAFDCNVIPDAWTLPGISCVDIREGDLRKRHAVKGYSIAAKTYDDLTQWENQYGGRVIPTTGIGFAHVDDFFSS